jgi:signal transduction histidine kinase
MKVSKLYIKIFFSFLILLVVVQLFIFGLFRYLITKSLYNSVQLDGMTEVAMLVANEVVRHIDENDSTYTKQLNFCKESEIFRGVHAWMEYDGKLIGNRYPIDLSAYKWTGIFKKQNFTLYVRFGTKSAYYFIVPFMKNGHRGTFHEYRVKDAGGIIDHHFVIGLALITVISALILLPLSRYITTPLKNLTNAAQKISRGDFSHRIDTCSGVGEIGELSNSFEIMRKRIDSMIGGMRELAANVSHQIRSPLARMRVASEILRERIERGDHHGTASCLGSIEREIEAVDRLAGSIITLMKKDVFHRAEEMKPIDLNMIARDIVGLYREMMDARSIGLELTCSDKPVIISGVADDINTLVEILVDNAVKYTEPNGVIRVEAHTTEKNAFLSIWNSAQPLDEEKCERIFEPFTRNSSEKIPGYGLGLAIAQRIARAHNGTLSAKNIDGGIAFELSVLLDSCDRGNEAN